MRVRNIKIAIKSDAELFNEIKEVCEKLERGEKAKKHEGISFKNIETMRKFLTEARLRIIKGLYYHKLKNHCLPVLP